MFKILTDEVKAMTGEINRNAKVLDLGVETLADQLEEQRYQNLFAQICQEKKIRL